MLHADNEQVRKRITATLRLKKLADFTARRHSLIGEAIATMFDDYKSQSVNSLRKQMRKRFPITRGSFAASATKEECLKILSGEEMPELVMEARANMTTATPVEPPTMPAEGVHGEGAPKPPDELPSTPDGRLAEVQRILRAVSKDNLADEVGQIAQQAKDAMTLERSKDHGTDAAPTGDVVKVAGVEWPIREAHSADHDENYAVPTIDTGYRFDFWRSGRKCGALTFEQEAADLLRLLDNDERILIVGPPATGKTSVIEQFAARVGWPVTRFNGNRDVTVQDFVGCYEAIAGETRWVDGPLPVAMKNNHILILDEVDHMPAECSSVMHSVLEPGGKLHIPGQKPIGPSAGFRIVSTANTAGFGDESGLHPNAQVQDAAFLSRFGIVFRADYMSPAAERDILRKLSGIPKADAEVIVKMANDTRRAAAEHQLMYPITLRQTMAMAKMVAKWDWGTSLTLAVLNKLPEQDVGAVAEIAQRHLGDKLGGSLVV